MLKRSIAVIFLLLAFAVRLFGQSEAEIIKKGLKYAYDLNFEKADSLFNSAMAIYPDSPAGFHFLSQNHFWKYLGSRDSSELIIFNRFSDLAIGRAESKLGDRRDDFTAFILASAFTLKAAAKTGVGDSWGAFLYSKKAIGIFEDILNDNPKYYDAYLGLGIFNYALSYLPGIFKLALDLTGLSHDREKALIYLNRAFNQGSFVRDEAAFHLSKAHFEYTGDYPKALSFIDLLIEQYPHNLLFYYQKALIKIEQKQLKEAESLLKKIIETEAEKFTQTTSFSYFLIGDIYFMRNDFAKAIEFFERYFVTTSTLDYLGYANLRCALAYAFIGDKRKVREHLTLARNGNMDIGEDEYAASKSMELLEEGLTEEYKRFIWAFNLYSSGEFIETINYVDSLIKKDQSRCSLEILKAAALVGLNRYEESERLLGSIVLEDLTEDWLESFAELTFAISKIRLGLKKEGAIHLKRAERKLNGFRTNYLRSKINFWKVQIGLERD